MMAAIVNETEYKDCNRSDDATARRRAFALQIRRRRMSFCEKLARSYQRVQHDCHLEKDIRTVTARQKAMGEQLTKLQERYLCLVDHRDKVIQERRDLLGRASHCLRHGAVVCIFMTLILQVNCVVLTWCFPGLFWEETQISSESHLYSTNIIEEVLCTLQKEETWLDSLRHLITAIYRTAFPE